METTANPEPTEFERIRDNYIQACRDYGTDMTDENYKRMVNVYAELVQVWMTL